MIERIYKAWKENCEQLDRDLDDAKSLLLWANEFWLGNVMVAGLFIGIVLAWLVPDLDGLACAVIGFFLPVLVLGALVIVGCVLPTPFAKLARFLGHA
jgi:hypothetical protein